MRPERSTVTESSRRAGRVRTSTARRFSVGEGAVWKFGRGFGEPRSQSDPGKIDTDRGSESGFRISPGSQDLIPSGIFNFSRLRQV
jgi:hypothetical protein